MLEDSVPVHAHSGCGLTSKEFLEKAITNNNGTLPYSKLPMPTDVSDLVRNMDRDGFLRSTSLREWYRSAEIDGEIAFTNGIALSELSPRTASLEQVFLELTESGQEYRLGETS